MNPQPKPETRARVKRRQQHVTRKATTDVRTYVFARERNLCRCCRWRAAESMHELRPRSLRGKVSRTNSVAVCGSGTTGCHGHLQAYRIRVAENAPTHWNAELPLSFQAQTVAAAEWMRVRVGAWIESPTMREMELAE